MDPSPKLPCVAIVGRPNVGKSALFNRLVGHRAAIVFDQPGVTRDRIEGVVNWGTASFRLLDTGGVGWLAGEKPDDDIIVSVRKQIQRATGEADLFFFVVNSQDGRVPLDDEVAKFLRRTGKPTFVVANKSDNETLVDAAGDFAAFGFKKIYPVSALHSSGVDDLLEAAVATLPKVDTQQTEISVPPVFPLKIAIIGRPNVGKSSLINRLVHDERLIVNSMPGTTRDSVDVPCVLKAGDRRLDVVLVDTAGIRRAGKIHEPIEFFSVRRAEESIKRCNLAVLLLDAEQGITAQDKKVGGLILEAGKGCVLAMNKWDLIKQNVERKFLDHVGQVLFFLDFAPVVFLSAKTGYGLSRLTDAIHTVAESGQPTIATGPLNRIIADAVERRALSGASRFKIYYSTQRKGSPPTFILFVNEPKLWTPAAEKYLANRIREHYPYVGWPIRFDVRAKSPRAAAKEVRRG